MKLAAAAATAAAFAVPSLARIPFWAIVRDTVEEKEPTVEEKELMQYSTLEQQEAERQIMQIIIEFDECVRMQLEDCRFFIQEQVRENPVLFEGRTPYYSVRHVRSADDPNYNLVALRTNLEETHVVGVEGDGMVYYHWDWCPTDDVCYPIGPWDCDIGTTPLTVEQCCDMIKSSVPDPDKNGKTLECHKSPPVGSASNPTDRNRVSIHVNNRNIVVRPPKNE